MIGRGRLASRPIAYTAHEKAELVRVYCKQRSDILEPQRKCRALLRGMAQPHIDDQLAEPEGRRHRDRDSEIAVSHAAPSPYGILLALRRTIPAVSAITRSLVRRFDLGQLTQEVWRGPQLVVAQNFNERRKSTD